MNLTPGLPGCFIKRWRSGRIGGDQVKRTQHVGNTVRDRHLLEAGIRNESGQTAQGAIPSDLKAVEHLDQTEGKSEYRICRFSPIANKELVVKLITVLMTVFMLWGANVLAGEAHFLLGVDGMSCPFCVYGIEKRLKKIDGVEDVSADLAQGNIWVEATGADVLSEDSARSLLEDAGFTLRTFEVHQLGKHEPKKDEHGKNESGQDE